MQCSSFPMSRSPARIPALLFASSGLVITAVIPAAAVMERKAEFNAGRSGRPKETLLAPHTVFTPNSSLTKRSVSRAILPAFGDAPTGSTNGSMRTSAAEIP